MQYLIDRVALTFSAAYLPCVLGYDRSGKIHRVFIEETLIEEFGLNSPNSLDICRDVWSELDISGAVYDSTKFFYFYTKL